MNGEQFIRRARKWAKANNLPQHVESSRGKGGHVVQYVSAARATLKTGEIGSGLLQAMLKQLGIPKDEF